MNLTARLLEWMIGPLLFFWLISIGTAYLAALATANIAVDQHLESVALVLKSEWQQAQTSAANFDFPSSWSRQWLLQGPKGSVEFAVVDEFWNLKSGDAGFSQALLDYQALFLSRRACTAGTLSEATDLVLELSPHRVRCVEASSGPDRLLIFVAQNKHYQTPFIRSILLSEAIPQSVILLLALGLVWYGITYVSRPMSELRDQLSARGTENLTAIETHSVPHELEPLMQGINELMSRLRQSLLAQQRFISDAAHQLRTPLAALRTQSELLISLPEGVKREHALQRLLSTTERAIRLSTQLLSLARAGSAATTADRSRINLGTLCESVVTDVAETAIARDLEFSYDAGDADFEVLGDETLLGELIRNLLDNAFKYTPRQGSVSLSLNALHRELLVEDSGPGIPAGERESIFAPFARRSLMDRDTGHAIAGSGLGLASVREVARAHRAEISVSESVLGGARFSLRFL